MRKLAAAALTLFGVQAMALAGDVDDEILTIWPKDHGTFLFVGAQDVVDDAVPKRIARMMGDYFGIDIRFQRGKAPDVRSVAAELTRLGARGAIWIVDDPLLPLTLGACEDGWGFVNVRAAMADKPAKETLELRVHKLLLRLFGDIHNVRQTTMVPHCVMTKAVGLKGLDALECPEYSPEPVGKILDYLVEAGYKPCHVGTYADACAEGWAPPPTNAAQRVIWDKVHQLPTSPLPLKKTR